jgi:hypothetical protein
MNQHRIRLALAITMTLASCGLASAAEDGTASRVVVEKIDHVMVCVSDLERAAVAYADLFGDDFHAIEPLALDGWGITRAAINATGIELIQAAPAGPAAEFIQTAGETLAGIARSARCSASCSARSFLNRT